MSENCLKFEEKEQFSNCLTKISDNYGSKFEELKKLIILLRRAAIEDVLQL